MTLDAALHSDIFLTYLVIILGILGFAGSMLLVMTLLGKDVSSVCKTYRGWLIMIPVVLGTIFLGRTAFIVGVALLAIVGFKEFARATGLYEDWGLTGLVYFGIVLLGGASYITDPRLDYPGWYGLFMSLPAYVVGTVPRGSCSALLWQSSASSILDGCSVTWAFSRTHNTPMAMCSTWCSRSRLMTSPRSPAANSLESTSCARISVPTRLSRGR
jgi:hypothetical protein